MQLPINAQVIINEFEKELGEKITPEIANLFNAVIVLVNNTYDKALKNTIKGIENIDIVPMDKQKAMEEFRSMFEESGKDFSDNHKALFEMVIDLSIDAYKQGEISGYNKALKSASHNSKIA